MPADPPHPVRVPLTLDALIGQLIHLRALYPEQGPRPVHLLDVDDAGDGLVTDIDLDCFGPQQGPVTSLLSSPAVVPEEKGPDRDTEEPGNGMILCRWRDCDCCRDR